MAFSPGDRVRAEVESTERPARRGVIEEVVHGDPHPRYRIRWDDGRESIYTPADGALKPEHTTTGSPSTARHSRPRAAKRQRRGWIARARVVRGFGSGAARQSGSVGAAQVKLREFGIDEAAAIMRQAPIDRQRNPSGKAT